LILVGGEYPVAAGKWTVTSEILSYLFGVGEYWQMVFLS